MIRQLTKKSFAIGMLTLSLTLATTLGVHANEEVYKKVAPSVAVVQRPGGSGTAWVIDVENRLLVTARHVVADGKGGVLANVDITLAKVDKGHVITDWNHYLQNKAALTVQGTVVYENARRDMALIQVPALPAGTKALTLAKELPRPGQDVHVIGSSSINEGGVFGYCYGKVRNNFLYNPPRNPILAHVVAHHTPTNKGDSGGPVVNNAGEVVGFISEGTIGIPMPAGHPFHAVQVTDYSINAFEIKAGLDSWVNPKIAVQRPR